MGEELGGGLTLGMQCFCIRLKFAFAFNWVSYLSNVRGRMCSWWRSSEVQGRLVGAWNAIHLDLSCICPALVFVFVFGMLLERGGAESWGIEGTLMMEESAQNCATVQSSTSSLLGTTIQQSRAHGTIQGCKERKTFTMCC